MERFELLREKYIYIILVVLTGLLGYFALSAIYGLPKPETIPELIKYYFNSPGTYAKAIFLTLCAFSATVLLGFTTVLHAIDLHELHIAIRIILGVIGVSIIVLGFYFFSYFLLLLIALIIIAVIGMIIFSNSDDRRRR